MQPLLLLPGGAYTYLTLTDAELLRQCTLDTYQASGPGGQKRNRTYSAVRIVHRCTGITCIAAESRSQLENKQRAVKRLKVQLALCVRTTAGQDVETAIANLAGVFGMHAPGRMHTKNPRYPLVCAVLLDALFLAQGSIGDAASAIKVTTGRLNGYFKRDPRLLAAANLVRNHFGLKRLKG